MNKKISKKIAVLLILIFLLLPMGALATNTELPTHNAHTMRLPSQTVDELLFNDVLPSDWFYNAVTWASENGIVNGVSETEFAPGRHMTRAMLVTVLWRYAGMPDSGEPTFADVASNRWYSEAIAWAAENEIVLGYNESTFGPNDFITREQMYTVLYRFMHFASITIQLNEELYLQQIADADDISRWAREALHFMFNANVMFRHDTSDLYARPQDNALRSEIVGALYIFHNQAKGATSNEPMEFYLRRHRTRLHEDAWNQELGRFAYPELPQHPALIRSMNQLNNYMEYFCGLPLFWDLQGNPTYMNDVVFSKYSEDFFKERMLVILYITESSGHYSHNVDAVLENGNILITRRIVPIGVGIETTWHILIELERSMIPKEFTMVISDAYCPMWDEYEWLDAYPPMDSHVN